MTIFVFNQPKKTIRSILYLFSLLMLLISIIAIIAVVLWREYPQYVAVIDKNIPNFYMYKMEGIYKNAKEASTDKLKYKYYYDLYESLDGTTPLNKYYAYRQKSIIFLVDYYTKNNQLQNALELSEKWKKTYPYEFSAKFKYSEVLALTDKNKAKLYLQQLYKKHADIRAVHSALQFFLIKNGFMNEALSMGDNIALRKGNTAFRVYFIDGKQQEFTAKQTKRPTSESIDIQGGKKHSVKFSHNYNKFKGIRLDLDGLELGRQFEVLSMSLGAKEKEYPDIKIQSFNHIKNNANNRYEVSGDDPYLILSLPDELRAYVGVVDLIATIDIFNPSGAKWQLIDNKEWQIFYSQSSAFKEKQPQRLSFSFESDNVLKADLTLEHIEASEYIRVDVPSFNGFKMKSINVLVNESIKVGESEVNAMHVIIKNKEGYVVKGKDPYIVFKLNDKEVINKISVIIEI